MDRMTETHGGHRARLRQKVRDQGLEALAPHEIMEFLLYYAIPRQDVNAMAHRLIERFGSVEAVLHAEVPELMQVEGMGRRNAEYLARVGEAASACAALTPEDRLPVTNFLEVFRYAATLARRLPPPCFVQICLDRELRVLYQRTLCPSRAWGEPATLREALSDVLSTGARNVILMEFVGRLNSVPEDYDLERAQAYAAALGAAECTLLDLLIVGDSGACSLRQMGRIPDHDLSARSCGLRERYLSAVGDGIAALKTDCIPTVTKEEEDAVAD